MKRTRGGIGFACPAIANQAEDRFSLFPLQKRLNLIKPFSHLVFREKHPQLSKHLIKAPLMDATQHLLTLHQIGVGIPNFHSHLHPPHIRKGSA